MNDFQPHTNTNPPAAFCQNCGKSLDNDTIRKVGNAVYCEPCLAAKISAAPPAPGDPARPYGNVYGGSSGPGSATGSANGPAGAPLPFNPSFPNPGLAALLGLIPGVGAMYNEQYAKGVVHLIIFALLVSFSHVTGIFILFVFGWIAYMSIEAHHTAQARRDGTPLPNPFGFNDIGERMGFGSAWPGADPAAAARDAVNVAAHHINTAAAGFQQRPPIVPPPPAGSPWGAPADSGPTAYSQPYGQQAAYSNPNPTPQATYPYTNIPYTPVSTAVPPYTSPYIPPAPTPSRFPVGAVVLIGLGTFFLLSTVGVFNDVPGEALIGVILVAIGAWVFFRRMTETGQTLANDGSSGYQFRLFRALKGSIWLATFGLLWLLDAFRILRLSYTWPAFIILVGVMMIVSRTLYASAAAQAYYAEPVVPPAPATYTEPTPTDTHEGGN